VTRRTPKVTGATPVFLVADVAATMQWYQTNLGFSGRAVPEHPPFNFGIIARDGVEIFLQRRDGYVKPDLYDEREGGVWNAYLHVVGVRELFESVSGLSHIRVIEPLRVQPYGQTEFVIADPDGYVIVFAEPDP
jgi:hypothetical protein